MKAKFNILIVYCGILALFTSCKNEIVNLKQPESVVATEAFIYVANVNGSSDKKDGNGYISKLYKNGKVYDTVFIGNLDAPKGLCMIKNTLYFTDIDKVLGYNIITKEKVFECDLSSYKTHFLNDVCKGDSNSIFVSATDINEIFKINLSNKNVTPLEFNRDLIGPNGLDYWNDTLCVTELGNDSIRGGLALIEFKGIRIIYDRLVYDVGYLDGVFHVNNNIVFSDWVSFNEKEKVAKLKLFNLETRQITEVKAPAMSGCADIFYDKQKQQIIAPLMNENKVIFIPVK